MSDDEQALHQAETRLAEDDAAGSAGSSSLDIAIKEEDDEQLGKPHLSLHLHVACNCMFCGTYIRIPSMPLPAIELPQLCHFVAYQDTHAPSCPDSTIAPLHRQCLPFKIAV